ncbi:MAG: MBL fold metallo-hydrolase [Anaerolineae bacterium]|nr:MBL fold metallo-hydrolase [Anaerolineae bacterium]
MTSHTRWQRLSEHLYRFADTCAVYAVIAGSEAVLIDFGSGAVLDHLGEIGVGQVRAILHTHHHRDQCQGDARAVTARIPIWVPEHERRLFEHAELFWASKQLFDVYNVRNTYFSLTRDVPVAGILEDFATWTWGDYAFSILPTPGHTTGSLTLLVTIDGQRVAFTGDLLYAAGKVVTMYDMQYNYGAADGVEFAILSLKNLGRREPQLICPSHGEPMADAEDALRRTRDNLTSFFKLMTSGGLPTDEIDFVPVLPHVLAATYACSYFYVITSDSGRALLVDFGAPNFSLFSPAKRHFEDGETVRFVEHSLERLRTQYGVHKIQAVLPSHYHDDHVNGIPYLQRQMGVECWAYENMQEILENPRGELIGCVIPTPIRVHRTFRDGERFAWEGFEFTIHYTPGHADYHMGMFGQIDGHSVAFSGDNLFPLSASTPSLIYRNHVHKTSHQQTARLYQEYMPDILCGGHDLQREVKPRVYHTFAQKSLQLTQLFETLLPGEANFGLEPSWTQIYPYQSLARPGDTLNLQVRMTNFLASTAQAEVCLDLPAGWVATPANVRLDLRPNERGVAGFRLHIPDSYVFPYPRVAIAADVTFQGRRLGQIAEATVERAL